MLLDATQVATRVEAAWCITNLCSSEHLYCSAVVNCDLIPLLVEILQEPEHRCPQTLMEQVIWAIGNIAGDCPTYRDALLKENVLDALKSAFVRGQTYLDKNGFVKDGFYHNISWCVSNFARGQTYVSDEIADEILVMTAEFLNYNDELVQSEALWAVSQ